MNRGRSLLLAVSVFSLLIAAIAGGADSQSTEEKQQAAPGAGNPNYPARNPFYFEGKIDYELLGIDEPSDAWEYMQRGIHRQDDLEDDQGAVADYRRSVELNDPGNGTCQIVESVGEGFATLDPPPCMFTVRLRLGYLLLHDDPEESIRLFEEVLEIDPLRLEVSLLIAEAYVVEAEEATDDISKKAAYQNALGALDDELALTPTVDDENLSPDRANNSHVHWLRAEIYEKSEMYPQAIEALQSYLAASRWHSDVLPWRIPLAEKKIAKLQQAVGAAEAVRAPVRARTRASRN